MTRSLAFRVVTAILAVGLAVLGPGIGSASTQGEGEVGVPWTGRPGITESMAEIVARDRQMADRKQRPERLPVLRAELHKRVNPASPRVASVGGQVGQTARQPELAVGVPTIGVSFEATNFAEAGSIPPDTMGAVSPTQILIHVNGRVKLFDKSGTPAPPGTPLNVTDDAFWAAVSGDELLTDPEVEYDPTSGRWFLAIITVPLEGPPPGNVAGPNNILIAVSDGSTITDTTSFDFFSFEQDDPGAPNVDANRFADYPQMGVDANAVYIGANMFDVSGMPEVFEDSTGFVIDKSELIDATPALVVTAFRGLIGTTAGPYTPQGVTNRGGAATQGYFIGVDAFEFGELVIRRITDPGGTPIISGNLTVPVPSTSFPMFGVPQPSGGPLLDDLDDRLFGASIANTPSGDRLWTAHNIEVNASGLASSTGNRDGSRWYEIGDLTGTPDLIQAGTLFDPASSQPLSYWIPTITSNADGDVIIGTSQAGANAANGFARVAVAQREATDPAGTLGPPVVVQGSSTIYDTIFAGIERWGDYSQTVVDPADADTFWTFQEYANASGGWSVRVIELQMGPPLPDGSMTVSPGPKSVTLRAKPRKVERGERTRLRATVSPCAGHEGDMVKFYRKGNLIAEKASNDQCKAKLRVKVKKTAVFRAVSPQQDADHSAGTSNRVKVKVTQ